MEELYINNNLIELPYNSISLTAQINDLGNIEDRQSGYSNSIKIPRTARNIATFEMIGLAGSKSRIPYESVTVKYIVNGIEIISDGKGILKNTNQYYNLVIYDGNISLSDLLGNNQLKTLDFTDYNHELNHHLYLDSFTNTEGYIYGCASYYEGSDESFYQTDLISPSFYVSTLFEMIFSQKGYTVSGSIFSDADFLSRVISMNNGYDRIANDDLEHSFFSRNNSTDPTIYDTFGYDTVKSYVIDTFILPSSNVYNISILGTIDLIHVNVLNVLSISLNGGRAYDYPILDSNLDFNINISGNQHDTVSVEFTTASVDVSGTETISFKTNYVTTAKENNLHIDINFNDIIGGTRRIDFVKDIMQHFGLIFRKTRNKNNFEFIRIKELLRDKSGAENWSDKYTGFSNETYTPSYAQENYLKYTYDDDSGTSQNYADGTIEIDNVNLASTKTLLTSIFKASKLKDDIYQLKNWALDDDGVININEDGLRMFKIDLLADSIKFKFNDSVENTGTYSGNIPFLNFNSINYQNEISKYYVEFEDLLATYKVETFKCNLSLIDFYNLDFFTLKYFDKLGKYYYLNKVSNFRPNKDTVVEFIEVGLKVIDGLSLIGGIDGSSSYSGNLTSLDYGGMLGAYTGSSSYIGTMQESALESVLMSSVGVSSSLVCSQTLDTTFYVNNVSGVPTINDTIYLNSSGTSVLIGDNLYFKTGSLSYVRVNNLGVVIAESFCI